MRFYSAYWTGVLAALVLAAKLHVLASQTESDVDSSGEPTCSLDHSKENDCSQSTAGRGEVREVSAQEANHVLGQEDLTRQVVSLTDETFDEITTRPEPATWLVMFKTDSCGICKKTRPIFENLSVDSDLLTHNEEQFDIIKRGKIDVRRSADTADEEYPKGPIYNMEASDYDYQIPQGPIYIATIDAGWSGRDTTRRLLVDSTPTIFVIRNSGLGLSESDPRTLYEYKGQRAVYPLRRFVMGEFLFRKKSDMPPRLDASQRKSRTSIGKAYEIASPYLTWAGGILGKIILLWFVFTGVLGVFLRVHNYAWGSDEDEEKREAELEKEKAEGRKAFEGNADEQSARRLKIAWEQKAKNRARFQANKAARQKKNKNVGEGGDVDDDTDEMQGVGYSVKKSDVKKNESSKRK
ncbi:hypothetical protein THAOC_20598 [Thalassiosira oceanica]|uniref:Thioredoxin domain-containing protein n=1 Tax=Thalassiosira oceanica TaxID=159749 RepID=K0S351_THAOC|nr:hypothetical protein THAOC_20598 [Thalassiosira oceanica]|eukprot:EJK59214.1 hypothetical protein THAOC_20598 [Thalassiosira oceanica]